MEERLNKKLEYLYSMTEKYKLLNQKTKDLYRYRLDGLYVQIEALENLKDNVSNEWDECYQEDLAEANNSTKNI